MMGYIPAQIGASGTCIDAKLTVFNAPVMIQGNIPLWGDREESLT
jgi:hypothetical protein